MYFEHINEFLKHLNGTVFSQEIRDDFIARELETITPHLTGLAYRLLLAERSKSQKVKPILYTDLNEKIDQIKQAFRSQEERSGSLISSKVCIIPDSVFEAFAPLVEKKDQDIESPSPVREIFNNEFRYTRFFHKLYAGFDKHPYSLGFIQVVRNGISTSIPVLSLPDALFSFLIEDRYNTEVLSDLFTQGNHDYLHHLSSDILVENISARSTNPQASLSFDYFDRAAKEIGVVLRNANMLTPSLSDYERWLLASHALSMFYYFQFIKNNPYFPTLKSPSVSLGIYLEIGREGSDIRKSYASALFDLNLMAQSRILNWTDDRFLRTLFGYAEDELYLTSQIPTHYFYNLDSSEEALTQDIQSDIDEAAQEIKTRIEEQIPEILIMIDAIGLKELQTALDEADDMLVRVSNDPHEAFMHYQIKRLKKEIDRFVREKI
jgi:hypothetical protein